MLEWLLEPLSYQFLLRGMLAAVMSGVGGGLLGCVLVQRRMALMGDALAHSLLPGLAVAYLFVGSGLFGLFLGALVAGSITAIGSTILSRVTNLKEDATFGVLFILCFGAGIAIISLARSRIKIDLLHFLFGNVLGVGAADLWLTFAITTLTLFVFAVYYRAIVMETFDPGFFRAAGGRVGLVHGGLLALVTLNLVAAMQTMGVVLALGLFLLPAVTASLWCRSWSNLLVMSVGLAVVSSVLGLYLSFHLALPSGPAVILVLGVIFFASVIWQGMLRLTASEPSPENL